MYNEELNIEWWRRRKDDRIREIKWIQDKIDRLIQEELPYKSSKITEINFLRSRIREAEARMAFFTLDYREANFRFIAERYKDDPQEIVRRKLKLMQEEV